MSRQLQNVPHRARSTRRLQLPLVALAALLALCAPELRAQVSADDAIKKILTTIDEELTEIDKLLLETSKRDAVGNSERSEQLQQAIKETQSSQERVVRGIDRLIEELEKQGGGGGGGGQGEPQEGQQQNGDDPLEDQQPGQRQDGEGPPQPQSAPKPQPGGQQGEQKQQGDGQPKNGQKDPQTGQQMSGSAPPEGGTERVLRERDRAQWGDLPDYDIHVHERGGLPKVPEKYRRLLEEYQRRGQKTGTSKRRR